MRGEELGGGGDLSGARLLTLLEPGEYLVLPLGNVELVEPANNFDVPADLFGKYLDRAVKGLFVLQVGMRVSSPPPMSSMRSR